MRIARRLATTMFAAACVAALMPTGCSISQVASGFVQTTDGADASVPPSTTPTFDVDATAPVIDSTGALQDAAPTVDANACSIDAGGPGPVLRNCKPQTVNECDGQHDSPGAANGASGNGFDDDCDGQVDEGCACPAAGVTKDCFVVPPSQVSAATNKPVGWCASNSHGTMECQGGEHRVWSGECRGALPPYADDVCAPGDFDCDGAEYNSRAQDCSCKGAPVQCPTTPLVTVPYPPPNALPLKVDATTWMLDPGLAAIATDWKWTLRGGDCDNILPHPTFALYSNDDGSVLPLGITVSNLGPSGKEKGVVATAPLVANTVYPAFSLSGDYFLEGAFSLNGQTFSCVQKIQVRAPGIRAEACWDTEADDVDLDLHMARTDLASCTGPRGWADTCGGEDCYYENCISDAFDTRPDWGYSPSASPSACVGWGSMATGTCNNPRLDRDANGVSGTCDASEINPNAVGEHGYCGPENINVDAPEVGSRYAVALKYYGGDKPSRPHVNVYCNGARVLSAGYNPVTQNDFPVMLTSGGTDGDLWKVALVSIVAGDGGAGIDCTVDPVPSQKAYPATDGSSAYCVDNSSRNSSDSMSLFTTGGLAPLDPRTLCFH